MPFFLPLKVTAKLPVSRFKDVEDVNIEESRDFLLQKRRKTFRSKDRKLYRIVTRERKNGHRFMVAKGDDLEAIKQNEWSYIVNQLPQLIPPDLEAHERMLWLIAHFTQLFLEHPEKELAYGSALDLDPESSQDRKDSHGDLKSGDDASPQPQRKRRLSRRFGNKRRGSGIDGMEALVGLDAPSRHTWDWARKGLHALILLVIANLVLTALSFDWKAALLVLNVLGITLVYSYNSRQPNWIASSQAVIPVMSPPTSPVNRTVLASPSMAYNNANRVPKSVVRPSQALSPNLRSTKRQALQSAMAELPPFPKAAMPPDASSDDKDEDSSASEAENRRRLGRQLPERKEDKRPGQASNNANAGKIKPGTTIKCVKEGEEGKAKPTNSFGPLAASTFNVRIGPNYGKLGKKAPSHNSLYELVSVDIYSADHKMAHIGRHFQMPKRESDEVFGVPSFFIVNCMMPGYAPSNPVWGEKKEDGEGYSLVYCFALTPASRTVLTKLAGGGQSPNPTVGKAQLQQGGFPGSASPSRGSLNQGQGSTNTTSNTTQPVTLLGEPGSSNKLETIGESKVSGGGSSSNSTGQTSINNIPTPSNSATAASVAVNSAMTVASAAMLQTPGLNRGTGSGSVPNPSPNLRHRAQRASGLAMPNVPVFGSTSSTPRNSGSGPADTNSTATDDLVLPPTLQTGSLTPTSAPHRLGGLASPGRPSGSGSTMLGAGLIHNSHGSHGPAVPSSPGDKSVPILSMNGWQPPSESTNALMLIRRFINAPNGEEIRQRFKVITRVVNIDEAEFGGTARTLIRKYNGTPFLVKTTSTFYRGDCYFEIDIDVHRFSYLARVGLTGIKEQLKTLVCDIAFVIQGNTDDELPEVVLGCTRMCQLNLDNALKFPD